MTFDETIVIRTPATEVFKTLSNFRNFKKFVSSYQDGTYEGKGPLEQGSEITSTLFFLGRKVTATSVVTEVEADKTLAYESKTSPVPTKVKFTLERVSDQSTRVHLHYEVIPGSFFHLEESFLRPRYSREVSVTLRGLKSLVESKGVKV